MDSEGFKYYAFISYSHKDKKIAKKLQKRLESYHLPSSLQKSFPTLPKKLTPVFIDESNLVATGSLKAALQSNLARSNYLILICSPNSARSEYVNDEVDYFIRSGRADHIIPLIVGGIPYAQDSSMECFPPAILALSREDELLGIDLKKFGVRDAFLRVIATMLRLDLDSFVSREARERKKKAMIFTPIAAALAISLAGLVWYSIEARSSSAYLNLGNKYYNGYGVEKDYAKALECFEKAANNGDVYAQVMIGAMYFEGRGVAKDYAKALECFEKAANNGNDGAQYAIGIMYHVGYGVEQNYAKAMEWLEKAADNGNAFAQTVIGCIYYIGWGVEQNYTKAMEWLEKAADNGNADASDNIGNMYYYGRGVKQDYAKALEWYTKSALKGNVDALNIIGNMYQNGLGVERDYTKAMEWYTKAANKDNYEAQNKLNELKRLLTK